jgi:SAM-dependent methyltransferase
MKENPIKLFWLNFRIGFWNFIEFLKVIAKYYPNGSFARVDFDLLRGYFLESPYKISKEFLIEKGEKEVYAYGETPLTTLEKIAKISEIKPEDTVFELGCGRGRTCFWLKYFIGCSVVGVEYIRYFVEQANRVKTRYGIKNIDFKCEDMLLTDLSKATIIYLYGTCLDEIFIQKLIKKFEKLPSSTKIITISYPLTDYTSNPKFKVKKSEEVDFPWGKTTFFIHVLV